MGGSGETGVPGRFVVAASEPGASADPPPKRKGPPLASPGSQLETYRRLTDHEYMLAVLGRELPLLTDAPIRVVACRARPHKIKDGSLLVTYRVGVEVQPGAPREYLLLGLSPVTPVFPGPELRERFPALQGHPALTPFREPTRYIPELDLGLLFFPLDPKLTALADITGPEASRLLADHLPECRTGATIDRLEREMCVYKPLDRAILRITAILPGPIRSTAYVKVFHGEKGASAYRSLRALWDAAAVSKHLRVPEPLGYDADRRMLVMSEAPGRRDLRDWIHCLERGQPLPAGIDLERLDRCMVIVARALRELQLSGIRPDRESTFSEQLADLARKRDRLREQTGKQQLELLGHAERLIERLEALAPAEEELLPAHGGFRHGQIVGDDRCLTVIDWDGFCLANPALDAATFAVRLLRRPLRNPGSAPELEHLGGTFRREFLAQRPDVSSAQLALYEGLVLTDQMIRSFLRPSKGDQTSRQILGFARAAGKKLDCAAQVGPARTTLDQASGPELRAV